MATIKPADRCVFWAQAVTSQAWVTDSRRGEARSLSLKSPAGSARVLRAVSEGARPLTPRSVRGGGVQIYTALGVKLHTAYLTQALWLSS